jgi:trans-aconitate methyltransferase
MRSVLARALRSVPVLPRVLDAFAPNRSAAVATRRNTREAYETVYGSDRLVAEYLSDERVEFYEELAEKLSQLEPRSIADVGCGTGHLLRLLVDRLPTPPERVVGIDHAEAGIRRARALLPTATWIVGDVYSWSPDAGEFDLVLCTEVLEHLAEPERVVAVLCRVCAPGGRVAITVPDGGQDTWDGHINFWDEAALAEFLADSGLVRIDRIDDGRTLLAWLNPTDGRLVPGRSGQPISS